ncbi:hypothetical protein AAG906_038043 [Vitis piasezkii]
MKFKLHAILETDKQQDLMNVLGATNAAIVFLGFTKASAVQSVVATERTVFYRGRTAGMYSELSYAFAQFLELVLWFPHLLAANSSVVEVVLLGFPLADKTRPLEIPGRDPMPVNEFLKENLGFDHDFRVPVVFAHLGWVFLFFFVFANGKSIEVMDMWKI